MVEQIRRFNRVATERAGALNDQFLGLGRPLGEARLLWEIGPDGCELRQLRGRLRLDSGYLSRLLRSLEDAGVVTVTADAGDRRVRFVALTAAGRRERATLDQRSDELARKLLGSLGPRQRAELVRAMGDVERLLNAAGAEIRPVDPEHPDARSCLNEYVAELNRRSSRGFDPTVGATALPQELRPPDGAFFVAYVNGQPVGCGGVKHHGDAPAELKRMWIAPAVRGMGLGRRLLETLEGCARTGGARLARIETGAVLVEALSLYRSAGWVEVAPFNDEPFADHWFEKALR